MTPITLCRIGAVAALAAISATLTGAAQAQTIELKFADRLPQDHYIARYATQPWIEEVHKATAGAVSIKRYPSQQLGKAKDMLTLTTAGVVDMGEFVPGYFGEQMPLSTVAEIPGLVPTACAASLAYQDLASEGGFLDKNELTPQRIKLLYVVGLPAYQLFVSRKIDGLESLEGLKIRSTGSTMDNGLRHLGIVPIRMGAPELVESFARGTVDGTAYPTASIFTYDLQKHAKYATTGLSFGSTVTFYGISTRAWDKLSPEVQTAMLEAGKRATKRGCELIDKDDQEALERLGQGGTEIVEFSEQDRKAFAERLAPTAIDWAKNLDQKGRPGTETLELFREAVDRHS